MAKQTVVHPAGGVLRSTKKNEQSSLERTRRDLECTLLGERSLFVNAAYCVIPNVERSGKGNTQHRGEVRGCLG